jgi:hypothetical protein
LSPDQKTVKRLFAVSGNRCAFPKCKTALVDLGGKVVGRTCHVRARSPAGPRYDVGQSDLERNAFENLLLLCPTHHDVVDADPVSYTVERLVAMKREHESVGESARDDLDEIVHQLILNSSADHDLIQNTVISRGQHGGIAAGTVNIYHDEERLLVERGIELQQHLVAVRDFLNGVPSRHSKQQADRLARSVVIIPDYHIDGLLSAARAFGPPPAQTAIGLSQALRWLRDRMKVVQGTNASYGFDWESFDWSSWDTRYLEASLAFESLRVLVEQDSGATANRVESGSFRSPTTPTALEAHVVAQLVERGKHSHRVVVENRGPQKVLSVTVRFLGDNCPVPENELQTKLPVPVLYPGTDVQLIAALSFGNAPPFDVVVEWLEENGQKHQRQFRLT